MDGIFCQVLKLERISYTKGTQDHKILTRKKVLSKKILHCKVKKDSPLPLMITRVWIEGAKNLIT